MRGGEAEDGASLVGAAEGHSGLYMRCALFRVDMDGPHRRQDDQEPARADRVAGDVVATTAHRHEQAVVACKADGIDYITFDLATHDRPRSSIDHCIPNCPRVVVTRFTRQAEAAAELRLQSPHDIVRKRDLSAFERADPNLGHGNRLPQLMARQQAKSGFILSKMPS